MSPPDNDRADRSLGSVRALALRTCMALASGATVVALGSPAAATVMVRRSVDELAAAADLVVVASVRGSHSQWIGGHIVTDVDVVVDTVARGRATAGEALSVRTPGGVVGDTGQQLAGAPVLTPGDRYVLFLRRTRRATLETVALSQGVLRVVASGGGATVLPADTRGLTLVDAPSGAGRGRAASAIPPGGIALGELIAQLHR